MINFSNPHSSFMMDMLDLPEETGHQSQSNIVNSILRSVLTHEVYRSQCIGLVPTENILSPLARTVMASDLSHRYLFQSPMWKYVGGKYLDEVESKGIKLAKKLFRAKYANLRALSGENCANIMLHGLLRSGINFYHISDKDGGHFAAKTICESIGAKRFILPYDKETASIDIDACRKTFALDLPRVIYFDSSLLLFPHPVKEIRDFVGDEAIISYDGSQVLGLIAGKYFQDPLREGSDFLNGSCHKTFPGPQKGIILTNREDLVESIEDAIFPGLVSNFHLHHVAALAITLAEEIEFGESYARQTIKNAKTLAKELHSLGFKVEMENRGFTETHQVWIDVRNICSPDEAVELLHKANIIANVNMIPSIGSRGLRLGTPEITRKGMKELEVKEIAGLMHKVLIEKKDPMKVKEETKSLACDYRKIEYCYS